MTSTKIFEELGEILYLTSFDSIRSPTFYELQQNLAVVQ
jgi:dihydroorotase